MKAAEQVKTLLIKKFDGKHVTSALQHFSDAIEKYIAGDWAGVGITAGKFVEAVTKALMVYGGQTISNPRKFSAGAELRKLENTLPTTVADAIRMVIPKACLFAYEIASNRGGRHDAHEVDANELDARTVIPAISWVLAEMIRFSASGGDVAAAAVMVEELTKKRYPYLEDIDGRRYINIKSLNPREIGLLLLYSAYPERILRQGLVDLVVRHGTKKATAKTAVQRLKNVVDEDVSGWKLRGIGREEAESLLARLADRFTTS
ncbi:MAG: hypothetical protein WA624_20570 [Methylocella sp.]